MGFSRQEYWSGLPFPPPGDLPDPGIEPGLLHLLTLAGRFFTTSTTREALVGFLDINLAEETGPYRLLVSLSCFT